jgi:hypothetical protein
LISASVIAMPTAPSAHADPPAPIPEPILPSLVPGQVIRIGPTAGTGTPTRDYDVGATDLCEFMEFTSGILQVCGDSFAGQGVGFGPWHSPIALHVESESIDDQSGVRYDRVTGNDKPLLADPTPAATSSPGSTLDELRVFISQWNTGPGDNSPYRVIQFAVNPLKPWS